MRRPLSKSYRSRDGVTAVTELDTDIFTQRYFRACLDCTFCDDVCCSFGATLDPDNVQRLEAHAPTLEAYIGVPREKWFTGTYSADSDYVGGQYTRTQVESARGGTRCVFLNKNKRGCGIHSYCLDNGINYHELKPIVCWVFPVTFDHGLLRPSFEVLEHSLVCMDQGDTLYQASRDEIGYYFGAELVAELDNIAGEALSVP